MDNEATYLIEAQMAETRQSLTDKVAALEDSVVGKVHSATHAVNETMQTMKHAVDDTFESVKSKMGNALDVRRRIREHPWTALGAATAAGFVTSIILNRRMHAKEQAPAMRTTETKVMPRSVVPSPPVPEHSHHGVFDELFIRAGDELKKLGEVVIEKVATELHRAVEDTVPRVVDKFAYMSTHSPPGEMYRKAS